MPNVQKISLQETVGGKGITLGTGTLAKQAGGAVTIALGETIVFSVTAKPYLAVTWAPWLLSCDEPVPASEVPTTERVMVAFFCP